MSTAMSTAIDFSSAVDAKPIEVEKRGRKPLGEGTPVPDMLKDSLAKNVSKAVTVPAEQVKQLHRVVNSAARLVGQGIPVIQDHANKDGSVTVNFQARAKRSFAE